MLSRFTASDVQVPPLHLIIMFLYKRFKGMAPGRLTVCGDILQNAQMLVQRWQKFCYPIGLIVGVWGLSYKFLITLTKKKFTHILTFRGQNVFKFNILFAVTLKVTLQCNQCKL